MELLIKIPEKIYKSIQDNTYCGISNSDMYDAIRNGTPLPKGHGRLIDADAFIDELRDSSKRQRYNECFIGKFLTVDDVFQAVIESLENKGSAEGDAPTIIEADEEEAEQCDDDCDHCEWATCPKMEAE